MKGGFFLGGQGVFSAKTLGLGWVYDGKVRNFSSKLGNNNNNNNNDNRGVEI